MIYRIHPSIGVARVGNSTSFFIGPERTNSPGIERAGDGTESPVMQFKDADLRTKRQAARFRIFEHEDAASPGREVVLPPGARVEWSVRLVNKKDAVDRPDDPPAPPTAPMRPVLVAGREDRVIDTERQDIGGPDAPVRGIAGTYRGRRVILGELPTDSAQRLVVVGGFGEAGSLPDNGLPNGSPIGSEAGGGGYYNNHGWFDDVGDGPVTAHIVFSDGGQAVAEPAWIVVAPPDFAPAVQGIVTLHDVIREVARSQGWLTLPPRPSFVSDIQPILFRAQSLQWVTGGNWGTVRTEGREIATRDLSGPAKALRDSVRKKVLQAESAFSHQDRPYSTFRLRTWQKTYLQQWVDGEFDDAVPPVAAGPRDPRRQRVRRLPDPGFSGRTHHLVAQPLRRRRGRASRCAGTPIVRHP